VRSLSNKSFYYAKQNNTNYYANYTFDLIKNKTAQILLNILSLLMRRFGLLLKPLLILFK